jgi:hypothetical protein
MEWLRMVGLDAYRLPVFRPHNHGRERFLSPCSNVASKGSRQELRLRKKLPRPGFYTTTPLSVYSCTTATGRQPAQHKPLSIMRGKPALENTQVTAPTAWQAVCSRR